MIFQEHKNRLSEKELIAGIKNNNTKVISLIYQNNYERIKNMVHGFKYLSIEPEDVFQEGLTRAIINVKNGKFNGTSSFSTYLYGICRNICLKDYQKNKNLSLLNNDNEFKIAEEESEYFEALANILKAKENIDENCRKIIDLRFGFEDSSGKNKAMRFDAIAERLNISPDNARQRFGRCLKKLKKLMSGIQIS